MSETLTEGVGVAVLDYGESVYRILYEQRESPTTSLCVRLFKISRTEKIFKVFRIFHDLFLHFQRFFKRIPHSFHLEVDKFLHEIFVEIFEGVLVDFFDTFFRKAELCIRIFIQIKSDTEEIRTGFGKELF